MNNLSLHKFITENSVESRWEKNDDKDDVLVWVNYYDLKEFADLIGSVKNEGGVNANIQDYYACFWMRDICEYHGVDIEEIFGKPYSDN